jgi:hypothetical protein
MPTGGWSGLWNRLEGKQHDLLIPRGHVTARRVSKIVKNGIGNVMAAERVFTNLNEDVKQVTPTAQPGQPVVNGGMIPIAVNNLTPVPAASFVAYVEKSNKPTTYPVDASGNGGGGKMGLRF